MNEKNDHQAARSNAEAVSPLSRLRPGAMPQATDLGNELLFRAGDDLARVREGKNGSWLRWNDGWTAEAPHSATLHQQTLAMLNDLSKAPSPTSDPLAARRQVKLARHLDGMKNPGSITNILKCAGHQATRLVAPSDIDAKPHLLRAANGTVDLATGTLRPHRREDYLLAGSPIAYRPEVTPTRWLTFLAEVFGGDADLVAYIQKVVGYCLTQETNLQQMWVLNGAGSNGKSTFVNIVTQLAGPLAQTAPESVLCDARSGAATNDLARLRGIRLAVLPETNHGSALNEKRVKALVAGDPIAARFLYGEFVDFTPIAKYFLMTNHLPRVTGTDHGIWRRLVVIPFNQTFTVGQDPTLKQDLANELPGILAWAVEGARQYYADQQAITLPPALVSATAAYRASQDVTGAFIDQMLQPRDGAYLAASDLRCIYESWCEDRGLTPASPNELGAALTTRGYTSRRYGKANRAHWFGVTKLTEDDGDQPLPEVAS